MSQWERWIKRYVWDDERTPYFVSPDRMSKRQAGYEVFAYAVLLSCFFFVVSLASASSRSVAFYALSMVAAAVILGFTKHASAAAYCATAPVAGALYLALGGFPGELGKLDYVFIVALIVLWGIYSFRIIGIAKAYLKMPDR